MADARDSAARTSRRLRLELLATIVLAIATVLTAWSAFEATKWGGVQADSYSAAGALRTESVRASNLAGTQRAIDVDIFVSWLAAVADERALEPTSEPYTPQPGTLSGFLYERFRDEFRPAADAWLATRPLVNETAPASPFEMPEYTLAAAEESEELEGEAEATRATARRANQNGDNYVLLTVLFASVLFFAGVSTELEGRRARQLLFTLALIILLGTTVALVTFPIEI